MPSGAKSLPIRHRRGKARSRFSRRERQIVEALRAQRTVDEIAAEFKLSRFTVKTYIARSLKKKGVHSVSELLQTTAAKPSLSAGGHWLNRQLGLALGNLELAEDEPGLLTALLAGAQECGHARQAGLWKVLGTDPPRLAAWNNPNYLLEPNPKLLFSILSQGYRLASATLWTLQAPAWRTLEVESEAIAVVLQSEPCRLLLVVSRPQDHRFQFLHLAAMVLLARAAECRMRMA